MLYDLRSHRNSRYSGHTMIISGREGDAWTTIEGHIERDITRGRYTQDQFVNYERGNGWNGPYEGKGRYWNWVDMITNE